MFLIGQNTKMTKCPICFKKADYTTACNHAFCKKCLHKKNRYNTTYWVLKNQIRKIHNCQVCNGEVKHDKEGYETNGVACIDHDHDTGKIRGVLCHRCNKLEGAIAKYDCPEEWLKNLLAYLVDPPLTKPGIQ